jgi:hypothetical protein
MKQRTTPARACLPLPVGEGWGEGAQLARELEATIAKDVAEILEA